MPTFVYSPLLWGLLLVTLPVLIHLINMLRHRRVEWAAIEFLIASQKKNRRWVILKQLLLLLLRMTVVAAVVVVVAQPILRDKWSGWFGSRKTHHVILLDDSYSMSEMRGEKDLFDAAKEVARRIVVNASDRRRPQSLTLARFSQLMVPDTPQYKQARASLEKRLEKRLDFSGEDIDRTTLARLEKRFARMEVSESSAGVKDVLGVAEALFAGNEVHEDRVVYLVTDFRRRDWDLGDAIRATLEKLSRQRTHFELIDCGLGESPNLSVTRIRQVPGVLASGVPCLLEATVKNHGKTTVRNVTLSIEQDDLTRSVSQIERIEPGKERTERFVVRFPTPGPHSVAVRIDADRVAADNRRFFVADVPQDVPVLVIEDSSTGESARFLTSALAPGGSAKTGIRPEVQPSSFLTRAALERFAVIYFTDLEQLEPAAVERLERYTATGGSVVFFTGLKTGTSYVNDHLYRLGKGIFPVKLVGRAELMADPIESRPDLETGSHPIFRVFTGQLNSFLETVNVETYMAVIEGEAAKVLARLRGGAPLVLESTFGQGRVLTLLSTVAPIWNNWARGNPSFVVTMLEIQNYLSRRPREEIAHRVGEPLVVELDANAYRGTVRFDAPERKSRPKTVELMTTVDATRTEDNRWIATFDATQHAGIYQIRLTTSKDLDELRKVAFNVEAGEGDLSRFAREKLEATLAGVPFRYSQVSRFETDSNDAGGTHLQGTVLVLLVLMLIGEQILAWSCSYHPSDRAKGGNA